MSDKKSQMRRIGCGIIYKGEILQIYLGGEKSATQLFVSEQTKPRLPLEWSDLEVLGFRVISIYCDKKSGVLIKTRKRTK